MDYAYFKYINKLGPNTKGLIWAGENGQATAVGDDSALEYLSEVLKKASPTPLNTFRGEGFMYLLCPNCDERLGFIQNDCKEDLFPGMDYCYLCGQHLSWPMSMEELENETSNN